MDFENKQISTKQISFGKVALRPYQKKKVCEVELELSLKTTSDGRTCFSVCGTIWNHTRTSFYLYGQIYDEIKSLIKKRRLEASPLLLEVLDLWDKYHLNNLCLGTPEQEEAVKKGFKTGVIKKSRKKSFYDQAEDYLKSVGLYEVQYNGKPYRYGSGWIYRSIPEKDLKRIQEIMEG